MKHDFHKLGSIKHHTQCLYDLLRIIRSREWNSEYIEHDVNVHELKDRLEEKQSILYDG